MITQQAENMPKKLVDIPSPPKRLFTRGEFNDRLPAIAIVGTRKATGAGLALAKKISSELTEAGFAIISGLAMGIDTAAHEGCLSAGGKTFAVLAGGLNKAYPAQNAKLAERIIKTGGALISEYPDGTPTYKEHFLARNRITSGLSDAVIIIEAPERSGSIATAGFAAEQGREVFVIPGPAGHVNYAGSHKLIRDGARLASSTAEILEDLSSSLEMPELTLFENRSAMPQFSSPEEEKIFSIIMAAGRPLSTEEIISLSDMEISEAMAAIAMLSISGAIADEMEGYSARR